MYNCCGGKGLFECLISVGVLSVIVLLLYRLLVGERRVGVSYSWVKGVDVLLWVLYFELDVFCVCG